MSVILGGINSYGAPIDYKSVESREDSLKTRLKETTNPAEIFAIGDTLFKMGKVEEANKAFKKGISTPENKLGAATCSRLIGQYKDSIKYYSQLIDMKYSLKEAYFGRALAYRGIEEYNKAIEDFKSSISMEKDEYSYAGLGDLYILTGKNSEARSVLEEGNKFFPQSTLIRRLLERSYKN